MKTLLLMTFAVISFLPYGKSDKIITSCTPWEELTNPDGSHSKLYFRACEDLETNTGHFEIKNENEKDVKLDYTVTFNNGEIVTDRNTIIPMDDKIWVYSNNCIESIGNGVSSWKFINIRIEGDAGY